MTMIEWIASQQGALSMIMLLLVFIGNRWTDKIGAIRMYRLWFMVPVTLLLNNLPVDLVTVPSQTFSRYIVGIKPDVTQSSYNLLLLIWLSGAILLAGYCGHHYYTIHASLTKCLTHGRKCYVSAVVSSPMLFGLFAPKIVLTRDFEAVFNTAQQTMILEHESTHLRHGDHIWNAVALLIVILFWFNPLIWLGVYAFRINQELACDSRVVAEKSQHEKLLYAKALVQCAEHATTVVPPYPTLGGKSTMRKRIHAIKHPGETNKLAVIATAILVSIMSANTALASYPQQQIKHKQVNHATPIERVDPIYPKEAVDAEQEGSVVLQFDITETGKTDNVKVIESTPADVFDVSAREALQQWQYKPRIQDGKAQRQSDLLVQLDFKLGSEPKQEATTQ